MEYEYNRQYVILKPHDKPTLTKGKICRFLDWDWNHDTQLYEFAFEVLD